MPLTISQRPAIHTWHVLCAGFLQREGDPNGFLRLWHELHAEHAGPDTCVLLRQWSDDTNRLAELIFRLCNRTAPCIVLYGYSWGGWSAVLLARQLQRRGLFVDHLVLCDAVYRHWYWLGQWRAFWPWKRIVIPANVAEVTWFRQRFDWPRGHDVVAEDGRETRVHEPREVRVAHVYMDDLAEFRATAKAIARNEKSEGTQ